MELIFLIFDTLGAEFEIVMHQLFGLKQAGIRFSLLL